MSLSRRTLLKTGATAGALLVARPLGALAKPLGPLNVFGTSRVSRLFPEKTFRLVHADLHNHTLMSDGDGDPANAFGSMRASGLDVAALTDHATTSKFVDPPCEESDCHSVLGIDEQSWARSRELADAANADGQFVAMRGFEWSSPTMGHINVWLSETWIDPLSTTGASHEGSGGYAREIPGIGGQIGGLLDSTSRTAAVGATMKAFQEWLKADPSTPVIGGGADGIAGFNHPGRETGRFGYFAFDAALRDRFVSLEVFNRNEDYLFEGVNNGDFSPIVECLDKGWRTGLLGVTDEHGTNWGEPLGKGRAGLWVSDLSRDGVREAMTSRRFFATVQRGLRLDAGAASGAGAPRPDVQMGSALGHASGPVTLFLDVDRGPEWIGKRLSVQVLQTGRPLPTVVHAEEFVVGDVLRLTVPVDVADGAWVVLRVSDPDAAADGRADDQYRGFGAGVAYASPFWLEPAA